MSAHLSTSASTSSSVLDLGVAGGKVCGRRCGTKPETLSKLQIPACALGLTV